MVVSNRTQDSWALLPEQQGRPLIITLVPYGTRLPNAGGKWDDRVFSSPGFVVSNCVVGTIAKQPTVSVAMPAIPSPRQKYAFNQIFMPAILSGHSIHAAPSRRG
jgi:hypothetical protein